MLNFNIATPIHKHNPRAITTCWSAFRKNLKNEIKLFDYAKINSESTLEEKVAKFADAEIFNLSPTTFCTTFGTAIREDSHFLLTSNRSALFHTTGSTTTERPSIKTDSPLLYEMTSLLRTSASPPMSPHQSSCSNHTAKESTAPREPQRTLKTLYYFTQDSKRTHD
ncbi:hypothetical protein TNCV_344171 [Trichonephila clavipes]|nr:hypothetical protein TNCV_344171 [Trichonephila clavipes]